jgi:hypothetical protein
MCLRHIPRRRAGVVIPVYPESKAWNHETRDEDPLVIIRGDAAISRMAAEFLASWLV